jgi:uncharacterized membrane protein
MNGILPWNRRYALKSYISGSMWLVPLFAVLIYGVLHGAVNTLGGWLVAKGWAHESVSFLGLSVAGARSQLETVITLNLSFLVFTFGSLLVAIQVAGGQYTPRIIATTLLRDNTIRAVVGCFVLTLLFTSRVLTRLDDAVKQLDLLVAGMLGLVSVMTFLFLIDYAARLLRPVSLVQRVGEKGVAVVKSVYPSKASAEPRPPAAPATSLGTPARTVVHQGTSGVVLAIDLEGLIALGREVDGVIEFVPNVGDFLAVEEPLFHLYGNAAKIDDRRLRASVALGSERTMDQDPTFALRILVDIALKALSAAINDPTTAVLAIDQLHRLLRQVGLCDLRDEELRDRFGQLRLIYRTPDWVDFVHLSCTEIRHCGADKVQVARRMRSMLEHVIEALPGYRHAELMKQLDLLDRAVETGFAFPEDRMLARIPDSQGLGGALGLPSSSQGPAAVPPAANDANVAGR